MLQKGFMIFERLRQETAMSLTMNKEEAALKHLESFYLNTHLKVTLEVENDTENENAPETPSDSVNQFTISDIRVCGNESTITNIPHSCESANSNHNSNSNTRVNLDTLNKENNYGIKCPEEDVSKHLQIIKESLSQIINMQNYVQKNINIQYDSHVRSWLTTYKCYYFDECYESVVNCLMLRKYDAKLYQDLLDDVLKQVPPELSPDINQLFSEMLHWSKEVYSKRKKESTCNVGTKQRNPLSKPCDSLRNIYTENIKNKNLSSKTNSPVDTNLPESINCVMTSHFNQENTSYPALRTQSISRCPKYLEYRGNLQRKHQIKSSTVGSQAHYMCFYCRVCLPSNIVCKCSNQSAISRGWDDRLSQYAQPMKPNAAISRICTHFNSHSQSEVAEKNKMNAYQNKHYGHEQMRSATRASEPTPAPEFWPVITHVTSTNPNATRTSVGLCTVCAVKTNNVCLGCHAIYYCSTKCQVKDWPGHYTKCRRNSNPNDLPRH